MLRSTFSSLEFAERRATINVAGGELLNRQPQGRRQMPMSHWLTGPFRPLPLLLKKSREPSEKLLTREKSLPMCGVHGDA